tara:strand:- start:220 stop:597 length:378 start_codon:yes stop_codon:yes gene_type:complete
MVLVKLTEYALRKTGLPATLQLRNEKFIFKDDKHIEIPLNLFITKYESHLYEMKFEAKHLKEFKALPEHRLRVLYKIFNSENLDDIKNQIFPTTKKEAKLPKVKKETKPKKTPAKKTPAKKEVKK